MNESSIAHHTLNLLNRGMLPNILQSMLSGTIIMLLVTTEYRLNNVQVVKFAVQRFLHKLKGDTKNDDQYPTWYFRDTNEHVHGVIWT